MRSHWGIEKSVLWVLDVVFGEDASRLRRKLAGWDLAFLTAVVGL